MRLTAETSYVFGIWDNNSWKKEIFCCWAMHRCISEYHQRLLFDELAHLGSNVDTYTTCLGSNLVHGAGRVRVEGERQFVVLRSQEHEMCF